MAFRSLTILTLAVALASPALAHDGQEAFVVFRPDDSALSCTSMADEAAALSQHLGGRGGRGLFGAMGDAAKVGASFLIPGAGLAMAGMDALTREQRERREALEKAIENRWYYLNGLYAGRCGEQQAAAQTQVQPATPAN